MHVTLNIKLKNNVKETILINILHKIRKKKLIELKKNLSA